MTNNVGGLSLDKSRPESFWVVCESSKPAGDRADQAVWIWEVLRHAHVHDICTTQDGHQGHWTAIGFRSHTQEGKERPDNWPQDKDSSRETWLGQGETNMACSDRFISLSQLGKAYATLSHTNKHAWSGTRLPVRLDKTHALFCCHTKQKSALL